jgi:transposase
VKCVPSSPVLWAEPLAAGSRARPTRVVGWFMLSIPSTVSIFLYSEPTDMRKGFDGLSGIVRSELGADPLDGSLFLFVNRRRDRLKILHWDGAGYWLYYRLLEAGTFEVISAEGKYQPIDSTQLAMLLGGVSLVGAKRRKRYRRAS